MNDLLLIATWGLGLILFPWFGLITLVVIAGARRRTQQTPPAPLGAGSSTRFLFIIPAHDESAVIGITVRSCLAVDHDPERFQVAVIADNCTDETATIAEGAGALVTVRHDAARKSKGFALEDFFGEVARNPAIRPCDAYVLVDADTSVDPGLLTSFDRSLARGDDFIQGYYSVRNADVSWRTRMMTYAFSLANGVWLAGLDRLGLSVGLKGNGMCFRASALDRFPWRAHGLVEDMEFAWNLRIAGERVRFDPTARVYGEMVSRGGAGAASQRRRWESGRKLLRASFRRQLWATSRLTWPKKVAYAIDLDFPPLSRLVVGLGLASALATLGILLASDPGRWIGPATLLTGYWMCLFLYAVAPIATMNLPARYLLSLAHLPYYMLWKLSIGLLKAPQQWVRTPRESTTTPPSAR